MIRFNLNKMIHKYNREHPLDRLTIAKLSRQTGVSRHALTTLSGKHGKPSGIQFATLDKLISFFRVPVDKFISYTPSGVVFVLKDASEKLDSNTNNRSMMTKSVSLTILSEPKAIQILAMSQRFYRSIFVVSFGLMSPIHTVARFKNIFNNVSDQMKFYLYSRILAHSGMLSKKEISQSNNFSIMVNLIDPSQKNMKSGMSSLEGVMGLPKEYILKNQSIIHYSNGYHIIDKTTNQFRK